MEEQEQGVQFSIPQYNNSLSKCILSLKILAIIVPEITVTQKNLTELRSCVITELRTDQIQYSPIFSSGAINKQDLAL